MLYSPNKFYTYSLVNAVLYKIKKISHFMLSLNFWGANIAPIDTLTFVKSVTVTL